MKYILTIIVLTFGLSSYAQDISLKEYELENDSTSVFAFKRANPLPKRSALYSAIFPGLGQIYNKQYWKLGIVAGGLGAAAYFINFNNREYKRFRTAYIQRIDNDSTTIDEFAFAGGYAAEDLNTLQNQYRQYLEYTIIFTTVGYALNVLDAYVAAHLRNFDINEDISFKATPTFQNKQLGIALVLNFK